MIPTKIRELKPKSGSASGDRPALAQVRPNMGMDLMLEESDIIIKAMNELLDKGIGCLSLHDCLIVSEADTEDAKNAVYTAYAAKGNKKPLVLGWNAPQTKQNIHNRQREAVCGFPLFDTKLTSNRLHQYIGKKNNINTIYGLT